MPKLSHLTVGRPRTKVGLALHPLHTSAEPIKNITSDTRHLTFSELDSPTVRQMLVTNRGDQTVLLMAGSVLQGGHQNRVVEQSAIIRPLSMVEVRTACVEQGRWSGSRQFTGVVGGVPPELLRQLEQSIDRGRSIERPAMARADQGLVWETVKRRLVARGIVSDSSDYLSSVGQGPLDPADRHRIRKVVADGPMQGQVGVAVSNADGVIAIDVFGSATLLQENWERLVTSYFEDAEPLRPTRGSSDAVLDALRRATKYGTTVVWGDEVSTLERFDHHSFTGSLLTDAGRLVHARVIPSK